MAVKRAKAHPPPPFTIVGVGASAGGFDAFTQLLAALPADSRVAIIFVQHLAPHHASSLSALLSAHTARPVIEVSEAMRIEPGRVYVVPPNAQMELLDGHLHLVRRPDDRSQYNPIDFFFRSLARTLRSHAIGVVLSGTASDGAAGLREIKTQEGITFAQDPTSAKYDGMPRAAIATHMVDVVASPAEIAVKISQIAKHPYVKAPSAKRSAPESSVSEGQLERIFRLLLPAGGVNFTHYKTATIIRRLFRRMVLLRMTDVDTYITHLEQTPDEVVNLHNDLLIHVTRFFREPESFEVIAKDVLPAVEKNSGRPIRMWVAGCATGEEAYSLAIVVHETLGSVEGVQIFGTDVSESAVTFARQGLYSGSIVGEVSPDRLRLFFNKVDGGYRVSKALRDVCVFARQDLTRDPPFSRLDLICCRNVLIYMDGTLQRRLLSMFHYALKPDAFLVLGHAESIGYSSELFSMANKKHRVYRKKAAVVAAPRIDVFRPSSQAGATNVESIGAHNQARVVLNEANRIVMERYAPPSVLVDQHFQVVQFNGQTGPFLEPSPGEPSFNILKLAREGLLHGLRSALQAARRTRKPARHPSLRVRNGVDFEDVDLEVIPVIRRSQPFYLVVFEAAKAPARAGKRAKPERTARKSSSRTRVGKLEEELAATREYLQSTIQEIEAANEELQSANEEILSSNEELQSTNEELDTAKEELQSTNEELNTVNDELQSRNEELTRVNADLVNLLASVQIAIVIVSRDLRIRRFTPMAEKKFNLISSDVGRPFSQISSTLQGAELVSLVTETIDTVSAVERTVRDVNGEEYLLRIRPYTTPDNRIDGAVIALFDLQNHSATA
jgi:two-component system, chemotaxis family, CheB/CheR fusion protein